MSVTVNLNNTERVMYRGNNHIKCIYGPNNQLLWTEEPYFTVEGTGSGNIVLRIDNAGSATQATPAVIYYWKNVEPNAARDNYTGTITAETTQTTGDTIPYVAGDVIKLWRQEQTAFGYGINNTNYFTAMSNCKVYGNIASLLNWVSIPPTGACTRMFYYCQFTDCTGLIFPWDTIPQWGMRLMFYGCTQIHDIPFLPATTVGREGYHQMFRQCNGLVNVDLTQKMCCRNAVERAFQNMFFQTISLQSVKVPANINYTGTYHWNRTFINCTALSDVTCLDVNPDSKYDNWLSGTAASGTFTKATGANWSSGASGIPTGWTVQEI